jgi:serine/threonine protein phosphatase PrpC
VIADPEMFTINITNLRNLLLISDGIYERMNNQ